MTLQCWTVYNVLRLSSGYNLSGGCELVPVHNINYMTFKAVHLWNLTAEVLPDKTSTKYDAHYVWCHLHGIEASACTLTKPFLFRSCFALLSNKLLNKSFRYDIRKYSFTARIVNTWNSLADLILGVDSVHIRYL